MRSTRFRHRTTALIAMALAATALAACGSSEEAQKLSFEVSSEGKETTIAAPESGETGLAEITLVNEGEAPADLQLIRVEGDRSAEELIDGFAAASSGKPFPEWFFGGGGVGTTGPGESATVTQVLQPGTYYAVNTESNGPPDPKALASIEVTGDTSDEEVEGDATVTAGEYAFDSEAPLPAGKNEVVFDNTGAQPHHLLASRLVGDGTAEDALRFFKTEKGKPPLSQKGSQSTAVIEGGEAQLVTLDLEPGRYAFYCFITDRQGGPPHALKGMVSEIEVR